MCFLFFLAVNPSIWYWQIWQYVIDNRPRSCFCCKSNVRNFIKSFKVILSSAKQAWNKGKPSQLGHCHRVKWHGQSSQCWCRRSGKRHQVLLKDNGWHISRKSFSWFLISSKLRYVKESKWKAPAAIEWSTSWQMHSCKLSTKVKIAWDHCPLEVYLQFQTTIETGNK